MSTGVIAFLDGLMQRANQIDEVQCTLRVEFGPDKLPGDWRVWWEERAAIREYDGCMPRERAEALAFDEVLRLMARSNDTASAEVQGTPPASHKLCCANGEGDETSSGRVQ